MGHFKANETCQPQFELLSGYDSSEIIDKKIDLLFPEDKIATTLELLKTIWTMNQK
jgi:hypothetical protein